MAPVLAGGSLSMEPPASPHEKIKAALCHITFCSDGNVLYLCYPMQEPRALEATEHLKYG